MSENKFILPSSPFGNVFYHYCLQNDGSIIDLGEHFIKQSWRNRYEISGPNGVMTLSIPVVGQKGMKTPVREIEIDNGKDWPTRHWRSIKAAYGSAPYYDYYADSLESLYFMSYDKLSAFNKSSLQWALSQLGHSSSVLYANDYVPTKENDSDIRPWFKAGVFNSLEFSPSTYIQVFEDRFPFIPNLSVIDVLMNLGPQAAHYIESLRFDESQIAILGR